MFKTSLGLAHSNRAFALPETIRAERRMIGIGSRPVSAIRPAKTDTMAGTEGDRISTTAATCCSVISAVTFTLTPAATRPRTSGMDDSPLVFVMGILTNTFWPQLEITNACRAISGKLSANTSNEIGRSGISASTDRAKVAYYVTPAFRIDEGLVVKMRAA